jgi:rod shape-determining protein MreC
VTPSERADPKPFLYLAVGLVVWWLLPSGVRRIAREGFYEFQAPVLSAESHLRDVAVYWEKRSRGADALVRANVEQARQIAGLTAENSRLRQTEEENRRLRALLNSLPAHGDYRTLVARVVRRDINTWWNRLVLRRGEKDGVRLGSPVVAGNSVVGRVTRVHRHTCEVQLVSDPDFRASVNVEGSNEYTAVYQGLAGRPFGLPKGVITHLSAKHESPVSGAGISVFTSGSGGLFPPGLLLGEITGELAKTSDGLFRMGDVMLHRQLFSLDEATILVPTAEYIGEEFFAQ